MALRQAAHRHGIPDGLTQWRYTMTCWPWRGDSYHPVSTPATLLYRRQPAIVEADLRRGVSTAYTPCSTCSIHEAMARIVADPTLRSRVGRSLDHSKMKQVCQEYSGATVVAGVLTVRSGVAIVPQLQDIGTAFVDYNRRGMTPITTQRLRWDTRTRT